MSPQERIPERIAVVALPGADLDAVTEVLTQQVAGATIESVSDKDELRKLLERANIDLVLIDHAAVTSGIVELVRTLKLRDHDPAALVVGDATDSKLIAQLHSAGAQRCVLKEGHWIDELGPTVRHLLRLRRLEEENRTLLARLTEANVLLGEKNRRMDEFGATVAHDIRGPLAGISMKLDFLLETYKDGLDDRVRMILQRALDSSARLTDMVQAMYSYARLGKEAAKMEFIALNALVEQVVADCPLDQALDVRIGLDQLPTVWGNPELLRRVFMNLITNAVKYNDKKEIVLNIGNAGQVEGLASKYCAIYVEDNGRGMTPEETKGIFTLFSRGRQSAADTEGEGIGLAVAHRIIDLHYGKIWVESEQGKGTKFVFTLPVEEISYLRG